MGFFKNIFKKADKEQEINIFKMINDSDSYIRWNGEAFNSDIVRSCIRPKAKAIGKLTAKHVRDNSKGFSVNPNFDIKMLLEEPNPYMSGQMFQEKMAYQLELNHNAFALIKRDYNTGMPTEIVPINCSSIEAKEGVYGDLYLKFYFPDGTQSTFPYVDIIHLRKDYANGEFFGESPAKALFDLMNIINTTDQGIVKAIKNSALIRWLMKFNTILKKEDMEAATKDFADAFLSVENSSGVIPADAKYDLQQVKSDNYVPQADQIGEAVKRVHSFFNINERIIQSKFNEDEWNAFYESEIEPFALQLSSEFTRKLFTKKERGNGDKIVFEASSLQYASMNAKLQLVQMVDRGAMVPNEWRKILNLAPIEGGDEAIRRLDTAVVDKGGDSNSGKNGTTRIVSGKDRDTGE